MFNKGNIFNKYPLHKVHCWQIKVAKCRDSAYAIYKGMYLIPSAYLDC